MIKSFPFIALLKVFEGYGSHWFSCLVDLIMSGSIKGPPLNYFTVDLIVVMLSWSRSGIIPTDTVIERTMATSLFEFMIKNCSHSNRSVLKNNLQIVKTMLQVWKERLTVPYHLINAQFNNPQQDTKDNASGLQLLGLALKAGFSPFESSSPMSKSEFYTSLTNCLQFKYKEVYAAAAEVCGLALQRLEQSNSDSDLELLLERVSKELTNFSRQSRDRFVLCLFHMQTYYPAIVDRYWRLFVRLFQIDNF